MKLSKRESEVLAGIRAGLQDKEIARGLGVSVNTVTSTASRVYQKLGVSSRVEAVLATTALSEPVPHTEYERLLLAYVIKGEARGEPLAGMLAVGWSAVNRLHRRSWYGHTLERVLTLPGQYDALAAGVPDPVTLVDRGIGLIANSAIVAITDLLLAGLTIDPTNGATHFFNPDIVPRIPNWYEGALGIVRIGKHVFCQPLHG